MTEQPAPYRFAEAVRVVRDEGLDVVLPGSRRQVLSVEPCMCGCGGILVVDDPDRDGR